MTKGRNFVPSQEQHGIWFRHRGMTDVMENRSSGTTTGVMHSELYRNNSAHVKCPPHFLEKLSVPYKDENPFSTHDNRNSFQGHGVYFGQGLGKHKVPAETSQHSSADIITWEKNKSDSMNSLYREDFAGERLKNLKHYRRYSKHYDMPDPLKLKPSPSVEMWVKKGEEVPMTYLQTLANTQKVILKPNPWKYSYHAHSFSHHRKRPQHTS